MAETMCQVWGQAVRQGVPRQTQQAGPGSPPLRRRPVGVEALELPRGLGDARQLHLLILPVQDAVVLHCPLGWSQVLVTALVPCSIQEREAHGYTARWAEVRSLSPPWSPAGHKEGPWVQSCTARWAGELGLHCPRGPLECKRGRPMGTEHYSCTTTLAQEQSRDDMGIAAWAYRRAEQAQRLPCFLRWPAGSMLCC